MNRYCLKRRERTSELEGRLIVRFERTGRQSYLLGENWGSAITMVEIRPEKMEIAAFPGYSSTMLTKQHLDIVVKQGIESWHSALASVAGVYVIADRQTGKLYVGSATGVNGIWSRWCAYSETGHGNNVELIELLAKEGASYADNFQYGVLEIADTPASADGNRSPTLWTTSRAERGAAIRGMQRTRMISVEGRRIGRTYFAREFPTATTQTEDGRLDHDAQQLHAADLVPRRLMMAFPARLRRPRTGGAEHLAA